MRFERVIVTGGSGRLGRFVVDELLGGCALTVLDIAPPRQEQEAAFTVIRQTQQPVDTIVFAPNGGVLFQVTR